MRGCYEGLLWGIAMRGCYEGLLWGIAMRGCYERLLWERMCCVIAMDGCYGYSPVCTRLGTHHTYMACRPPQPGCYVNACVAGNQPDWTCKLHNHYT